MREVIRWSGLRGLVHHVLDRLLLRPAAGPLIGLSFPLRRWFADERLPKITQNS